MTTQTDIHPAASSGPSASLAKSLLRFRVAAYITGVGLLGLCLVMILRYGFDNPTPSAVYSPIHGLLYMVYLILTIDLAIKSRWTIKNTVLVLLAGCIPLVSFLAERRVTRRMSVVGSR